MLVIVSSPCTRVKEARAWLCYFIWRGEILSYTSRLVCGVGRGCDRKIYECDDDGENCHSLVRNIDIHIEKNALSAYFSSIVYVYFCTPSRSPFEKLNWGGLNSDVRGEN